MIKTYEIDEKLQEAQFAKITTEHGVMIFKLFPNDTPQNVSNFVFLAKSGFYDGLNFHRVIAGFVAQGGCPNGDGRGGPGWSVRCETQNNPHHHKRGTLSMAHAGRDTGGSQFFICFTPQPHLDGMHTIFGQIQEGDKLSFATLDKIREQDKILKVEILEKID